MSSQQRTLAVVAVAALAAIVIVVLVTAPGRAPETGVTPAASSTATATAAATPSSSTPVSSPSASRSVLASTSPAAGGRYGYVAVGGGGFALVDESGTTIQQYGCGGAGRGCGSEKVAVSPDGKHVGFWIAGQSGPWELRILDVAAPTSVRTVATLPSGFLGQRLAWSTDSQGILYAAETEGYGGISGGAGRATLTAIDLANPGAPIADAMPTRTDGAFYVPIAWDKAKKIDAAVLSGEGGFVFEYAVSVGGRYSATRAQAGQMIAGQIEASPDATRILGIDGPNNLVRIWPVDDFGKQVEVRPGPGGRISAARWRTPREVVWSYGSRVDVFIPQSDSSSTIYSTSGAVQLVAVRPDGSGGLISTASGILILDFLRCDALNCTTPKTSLAAGQAVIARGVLLR